jgi:hypothetical protein
MHVIAKLTKCSGLSLQEERHSSLPRRQRCAAWKKQGGTDRQRDGRLAIILVYIYIYTYT